MTRDRIDPQITSTDKTAEITQTAISEEEFNSELELFKSVDVVTNVVRELDLINDKNPQQDTWISKKRGQIKASIYDLTGSQKEKREPSDPAYDFAVENVVNRVVYNLDVVPIKKSRVIKVTYTDTDPMRAKKTLETVYQKFVQLHVELNEKPEATKVFNEQTGKFNQRLSDATNNLKNFDTRNGVIGTDISRQQGLLQKQTLRHPEENATRTEIGETVKRVASLQSKIAAEPEQIQTGYVSKYVPALDITAEVGIAGGVIFCLLLLWSVYECFLTMAATDRLLSALALGLGVGMIAFVISGVKEPGSLASVRPPIRTCFFMFGVILALKRIRLAQIS